MPVNVNPKQQRAIEEFGSRIPDMIAESNAQPKQEPVSQQEQFKLGGVIAQQDATIARRERLENVGFLGGWQRALSAGTTGHLVDSALARIMTDEEADPTWALSTQEYNGILKDFQLQGSNHLFETLQTASGPDQVVRMARDFKTRQTKQEELEGHGFKSFVGLALDPAENMAMIAAGLATGGGGAVATLGTRGARFAYAGSQVAALTGVMYAGQQAGHETTFADFVLAAAVGGTLTYAVGPTKGLKAAAREEEAVRAEVREAVAARRAEPTGEAPRTAEAPTAKATPETVQKDAASAPKAKRDALVEEFRLGAVQAAGKAMNRGAVKAATKELKALRSTVKRLNKGAEDKATKLYKGLDSAGAPIGKLPSILLREAGAEVAQELRVATDKIASIESELKAAEAATKAKEQLAILETKGKLPDGWEAKLTEEVQLSPKEEVVRDIIAAGDAVSPSPAAKPVAAVPPVKPIEAASSPAPVGVLDSGAVRSVQDLPEPPAAVKTTTAKAVEAVVTKQRGFLDVPKEAAAKAHRFFNELVSEYDKLTGGIPELQAFLSNLLDDPLRRKGLYGDNAASRYREYILQANTEMAKWESSINEYVRAATGVGKLRSGFGYSKEFIEKRIAVEDEIATEMLRRESMSLAERTTTPHADAGIQKLVELFEETTHKSAQRAKEAGLAGMEGYERSTGYFHRSWNYEKLLKLSNEHPVYDAKGVLIRNGLALDMIKTAALKGIPNITEQEAKAIAKAVVDRTTDKAQNARTDFMGQLGKQETDNILELMKTGGTDDAIIESVRKRLESKLTDKTGVKYVKPRLELDMNIMYNAPDGTTVAMKELIDTDLSRLLENYQQSMAGRSALARQGIGGDGAGVATYLNKYRKELDKHPLSGAQKDAMFEQMEHIIGDFTGVRPPSAILSPTMSMLKSLATATMLGSTGVLQVGESSIIMARHGALNTFRHMLQRVPGIRGLMDEIGSNPELYKEWNTVTGIDFTTDTRARSWKRQAEVGLIQDSSWQRVAYAQQQLVPTLTGQRWVHGQQAKMLLNQNLYTVYKASMGDADALATVRKYGNLTDAHLERVKALAEINPKSKSLTSMRMGAYTDAEMAAVMDTVVRMQDHLLLAERPGYGTSYRRSAVGQLLGQFTSYVGMAHNLTLRANLEHEGALGIAKILAYQYPMMLMVTYMNEVRKGNVLNLDNDEDMKKLLAQSLSYSSVIGMYGDAVALVAGSSTRSGVAAFGPTDALGTMTSALGDLAKGDVQQGAGGALKALNQASILGVVPGSQALVKALQEDK